MNDKKLVILNGSPRADELTTSGTISELAERKFSSEKWNVKRINVRKSLKGDTTPDFEAIREADAILFVFPLYFFCVPGMLMRFMEDYAAYSAQNKGKASQKVYTIVNCGFPEPGINTEAVRVIKSFSRHTGAQFGLGVCIGGGGMVGPAKDAPFMKKLLAGLDEALLRMAKGESGEDVMLAPSFPRWLYFMGGNVGWNQMAKKNGLKKQDLYRKPYAQ